jgi:hypothetical protein
MVAEEVGTVGWLQEEAGMEEVPGGMGEVPGVMGDHPTVALGETTRGMLVILPLIRLLVETVVVVITVLEATMVVGEAVATVVAVGADLGEGIMVGEGEDMGAVKTDLTSLTRLFFFTFWG